MISSLRPSSPPAALIASTAKCAPLTMPAPPIADSSAIMPMRMGSFDCAWTLSARGHIRAAATIRADQTWKAENGRIGDLPLHDVEATFYETAPAADQSIASLYAACLNG